LHDFAGESIFQGIVQLFGFPPFLMVAFARPTRRIRRGVQKSRQAGLSIERINRCYRENQLLRAGQSAYPNKAGRDIPLPEGLLQERIMKLKGSKTETNLKDAFAGESQANRRYLYFAAKADVEGYNDVSAVFRSTAEGETGHAHGHLEYLEAVGDPATGLPIGPTKDNLKAAIAGETHEYTDMYPGMAKAARDEGFSEIADWFETLAKAERSHANRFTKALDSI
jgi:rubrerythrin